MVIYYCSPIWPLCVAIVFGKVRRFSGSGRIAVRGENVKYHMAFSPNIARFPRRDIILLLSYGIVSVAKRIARAT